MDMPHIHRRTAWASIAVASALLAACQSSGHRRVDATSARLDQMRASLDQLESELKSTADSLAVVVEHADSGPEAALLIVAIRKTQNITELADVALRYADAMKFLPDGFVSVARAEYRKQRESITRPPNVLVKPQPKSNGHYNGIEI